MNLQGTYLKYNTVSIKSAECMFNTDLNGTGYSSFKTRNRLLRFNNISGKGTWASYSASHLDNGLPLLPSENVSISNLFI